MFHLYLRRRVSTFVLSRFILYVYPSISRVFQFTIERLPKARVRIYLTFYSI